MFVVDDDIVFNPLTNFQVEIWTQSGYRGELKMEDLLCRNISM
jgi:hypothetical protein